MQKLSIDTLKSAYFVGIGGVSMSSLALILKGRGIAVRGYDMAHSATTDMLEAHDIPIDYAHCPAHVLGVDALFYTAAVNRTSAPELSFAEKNGIPVYPRAALLGAVTASYKHAVGVAGTHGKSTTTGMIASIYFTGDPESSVIAGCTLPEIGGAYRIGSSDRIVFEACEYKDSFLSMCPSLKVVLNCKHDHVDYFPDIEAVKASFRRYMEIPHGDTQNTALVNFDCKNARAAAQDAQAKIYSYSIEPGTDADFRADNIRFEGGYGIFDLTAFGKPSMRDIPLSVPGLHNVSNAVAAAGAALLTGIGAQDVKTGLARFCGVSRRFEKKGFYHGALIIDDYAHHPDEIRATLRTARLLGKKRILCVFQPHTYSRTYAMLDDFAQALSLADEVFLAEIYPAREQNTFGVSSRQLAAKIPGAHFCGSFEDIASQLEKRAESGDLILTMGAGEAYRTGDILLESVQA